MKVGQLIAVLNQLTENGTANMDLDVLIRASRDDGDDILIASNVTLTIEETCCDDTLFIDVSDEDGVQEEMLQDDLDAEERAERDTDRAPPFRHLHIVKGQEV